MKTANAVHEITLLEEKTWKLPPAGIEQNNKRVSCYWIILQNKQLHTTQSDKDLHNINGST